MRRGGEGIVSDRSAAVIVRGKSSSAGPTGSLRSPQPAAARPRQGSAAARRPRRIGRSVVAQGLQSLRTNSEVQCLRRPESHVPTTSRERSTVGALRRNGKRRPRRMSVVLSVLLVVGAGAVAAGAVTAVNLAREHCDLDVLRPVGIGQNTFVYAADGTSLGSIPAERNRQPVPLVDISPWMRRATIAVEDRRFYRHQGVDYEGIARRALARPHRGRDRRGRLHADAAARPQPLHLPRAHRHPQAAGGMPRRPAQPRLVEAAHPPRLAEHRLLREPRVRRRGRLSDVLLEARA